MCLFLLNHTDDYYIIFNSSNFEVKKISTEDYNNLVKDGIKIYDVTTQTSPLGLIVKDNAYELHFTESDMVLYNGIFPTQSNKRKLFEHDIKITKVGVYQNTVLFEITCRAFCKYDIELPMTLTHILAFPIVESSDGELEFMQCYLSAYTSEPVLITDESTLLYQYEKCNGDYPKYCLVSSQEDSIDFDNLSFYGVKFDFVPTYVDLCRKLEFYKF